MISLNQQIPTIGASPDPLPNKPDDLCSHCGRNPADDLHGCPYQEGINANYEFECDCCRECFRECLDGI